MITRKFSRNPDHYLEKEIPTHSGILAWKIPWTEEPGRLQSMGSQSRTRLSHQPAQTTTVLTSFLLAFFFFFSSTSLLLPTHLPAPSRTRAQSCDPTTAAHQAPLPMDFSRQECWSGLPFPSPSSSLLNR